MSRRIEKVNSLIQKTLGEILQRDADIPAGVLVTIARVDTVPNLRSSTIWLSIFPASHEEEVLQLLTKQLYDLQGALNRALSMRPLPRISLKIDHSAAYAQSINDTLDQL